MPGTTASAGGKVAFSGTSEGPTVVSIPRCVGSGRLLGVRVSETRGSLAIRASTAVVGDFSGVFSIRKDSHPPGGAPSAAVPIGEWGEHVRSISGDVDSNLSISRVVKRARLLDAAAVHGNCGLTRINAGNFRAQMAKAISPPFVFHCDRARNRLCENTAVRFAWLV